MTHAPPQHGNTRPGWSPDQTAACATRGGAASHSHPARSRASAPAAGHRMWLQVTNARNTYPTVYSISQSTQPLSTQLLSTQPSTSIYLAGWLASCIIVLSWSCLGAVELSWSGSHLSLGSGAHAAWGRWLVNGVGCVAGMVEGEGTVWWGTRGRAGNVAAAGTVGGRWDCSGAS